MTSFGFPPPKSGNYFCTFRLKKREEAPAFRKTNRHIPIMKTPSSLSFSPLFPPPQGRQPLSGRQGETRPAAVQSTAAAGRQRPDVFSPPVVWQLFVFIFSLYLSFPFCAQAARPQAHKKKMKQKKHPPLVTAERKCCFAFFLAAASPQKAGSSRRRCERTCKRAGAARPFPAGMRIILPLAHHTKSGGDRV